MTAPPIATAIITTITPITTSAMIQNAAATRGAADEDTGPAGLDGPP